MSEAPIINSITISISWEKFPTLANEDAIRWIEPVPLPPKAESYRIRAHVQSESVQTDPYWLDGSGVTVGVFETSHVGVMHPDFSDRARLGDTDPPSYGNHATLVAGVIGGNGNRSFGNNRGMAPKVEIFSYDFSEGNTPDDPYANYIGDLQTAISAHDIDIANNS